MNPHFKVLYTNYYKRVYKVCLLILKDPVLAEEAAQEAFVKAYENINTLKEPSKFGKWVSTIAANNAIQLYNKNRRTIAVDITSANELFSSTDYMNPEEEIIKNEQNQEIRTAITGLKPPYNHLLILKYYLEMNNHEISQLLNMPIGTVKSSIYRAKQILLRKLPSINKEYIYFKEGAK